MGDSVIEFSFEDYQEILKSNRCKPPGVYSPYMSINRAKYLALEKEHELNKNDVGTAFRELKRRVKKEYFWKIYGLQVHAMDYTQISFPAYRFILPEMLADDWLAAVGWHSFNRDHIIHQPLTAYVVQKLLKDFKLGDGQCLMDACINEILKWDKTAYLKEFLLESGVRESDPWLNGFKSRGNKLKKGRLNEDKVCRSLWKSLFFEAAYLAAIFHDMGYPWQYIHVLSNKLKHAGYHPDSPISDAEGLVNDFGNRLLYCPLNGYRIKDRNAPVTWHNRLVDITDNALRKTHGFPGAIGFLYLNDVIRDYPGDLTHPIRHFCVEWAAMAIAMHDMLKIYWGDETSTPPDNGHMRLRFEVDPLSCVIALADMLEDFSRPVVDFNNKAIKNCDKETYKENKNCDDSVEVSYFSHCNSVSLKLDWSKPSRAMRIVYRFKDKGQLADKRYRLPKERRNYFDRQNGYIDLSAIGIHDVEMKAELFSKRKTN